MSEQLVREIMKRTSPREGEIVPGSPSFLQILFANKGDVAKALRALTDSIDSGQIEVTVPKMDVLHGPMGDGFCITMEGRAIRTKRIE